MKKLVSLLIIGFGLVGSLCAAVDLDNSKKLTDIGIIKHSEKVDKSLTVESNINYINYVVNTDGSIDVRIDLSSNELNSTTIETLRDTISTIKKNKNVNKVYIDIDSIK